MGMHSLYFGLVVHLLLVASSFGKEIKNEKDGKMLLMLELEQIKPDDRAKRATEGEVLREERQSPEVPQEYLSLLQQLAAQQQQQQQQQPQQQQTSATAQQPQQHLIQQLVVSRDGARQPTATRYVLSQDGRLLDESSLAGFAQGQPISSSLAYPFYQQPQLQQIQQQQSPLLQTQPQQIPQAPAQPVRPGTRPVVSEYTRQQQRILQEYRDAPLRAQIAGFVTRPPQNPPQPVPTGPNSQSPQIFVPAGSQQQQQQPTQQAFYPAQFQDPQNPNIVYTIDPQAYYQQQLAQQQLTQQQLAQQQLSQQQIAAQYAPAADPRQVYAQRTAPISQQQIIYQQPIPQEITQDKIRRPITVLPTPSAAQPQVVPQNLPQQYLIETTKPSTPQPPQYVSSDVSPQIQYVQQPIQQQQTQVRQPELQASTLLQPVAGRGLFSPVAKPSRSSIFVSRSSAPKSVSLTVSDEITSEKVPVVRLPSPPSQRTLSKQELDALVSAGYTITPVQDPQYLKSKRQQPVILEGRNHVVYENHQDGVQYQYSPGSSDATSTIKTKKNAPNSEYFNEESQ